MFKRRLLGRILFTITLVTLFPVGRRVLATDLSRGNCKGAVHYLEIVTEDVEALKKLYYLTHALSFGSPEPDLGNAQVATQADGTLLGIREPLAPHEQPIMRTYLVVKDIHKAVKKAEKAGGTIAYAPTKQGKWGTFAIVIQGDVEHGFWQQ